MPLTSFYVSLAIFSVLRFTASVSVQCVYNSLSNNNLYDCEFRNVSYSSDVDGFEIYETDHIDSKNDSSVNYIHAKLSTFTEVPMQIFAKFDSLRYIYLNGVKLKNLENPFINCGHMLIMNFDDNELKSVGKVFDECLQLSQVHLESNHLTTIDAQAFKSLINLEGVYLRNNKIMELSLDLITANRKLKLFDVSKNQLSGLPHNLFNNSEGLNDLQLQENPYKAPHDISQYFHGLSSLNELWMSKSNIAVITEEAFTNLASLRLLYLQNNQISEIHPKAFASLGNLEELQLSGNRLITIPANSFQSLNKVRKIQLFYSQINDFAEGTFSNLKFLEYLDLERNNFTRLRMNSFDGLPKLKKLFVGDSQLTSVSRFFWPRYAQSNGSLEAENTPCVSGTWKTFTVRDIRNYFSNCFDNVLNCIYDTFEGKPACKIWMSNITKIDDLMIEGNQTRGNVQYVFADNSTLDHIPQILFDEFQNLTTLKLVNVGLKKLATIENCTMLQHLNLEYNEVESLPGKAFESCKNLEELFLSGNVITSLDAQAFTGLRSLHTLLIVNSVRGRAVAERAVAKKVSAIQLDPETFHDLRKLESLSLSLHQALDIGNSLHYLENLTSLSLDNNDITEVKNFMFRNQTELQELSLSGSNISSIEEGSFDKMILLKSLDLSHNQLSYFPQQIFMELYNLVRLDLNQNNIKELPVIFGGLEKLVILNLANNQIASINNLFFSKMIKELSQVNLLENVCTGKDFTDILTNKTGFMSALGTCFNNFVKETFCIFGPSKFGYSCKLVMDQNSNENINKTEREHIDEHTDHEVTYLHLKYQPIIIEFHLVFERFKNLKKVELWKTSLGSLSTVENCLQLHTLDLRLNEISSINASFFSNCKALETLILVKNKIVEISREAFLGLTNLKHLDLGFNHISTANLASLTNLKVLKLSHNELSGSLSGLLNWVTSLKFLTILDLSHNQLSQLNFNLFINQKELNELHLNNNAINFNSMPANVNLLKHLSYLSLENNLIRTLNMNNIFDSLQYLDISNNQIEHLDFNFEAHKRLTTFFALDNPCMEEGKGSFEDIKNISKIIESAHECLKPYIKSIRKCNILLARFEIFLFKCSEI